MDEIPSLRSVPPFKVPKPGWPRHGGDSPPSPLSSPRPLPALYSFAYPSLFPLFLIKHQGKSLIDHLRFTCVPIPHLLIQAAIFLLLQNRIQFPICPAVYLLTQPDRLLGDAPALEPRQYKYGGNPFISSRFLPVHNTDCAHLPRPHVYIIVIRKILHQTGLHPLHALASSKPALTNLISMPSCLLVIYHSPQVIAKRFFSGTGWAIQAKRRVLLLL